MKTQFDYNSIAAESCFNNISVKMSEEHGKLTRKYQELRLENSSQKVFFFFREVLIIILCVRVFVCVSE